MKLLRACILAARASPVVCGPRMRRISCTARFMASSGMCTFGTILPVSPTALMTQYPGNLKPSVGFDHGVGHSLLLLYDAKAPYSQNVHDFNGLGQYPFNTLYKFIIN